jgi:hypothetical protein
MLVLFTLKLIKLTTMNKIMIFLACIITTIIIVSSCKKEDNIAKNNKWIYADSANNTNVRLIHCFAGNTPNLPPNTATGPQVFVYVNGAKLNGNALSYGGQWPSPSVYASIPQTGSVRLDFVMARLNFSAVPVLPAPIAGDTLVSITTNLEKGKKYSIYFSDTIPTYRVTVVEDQLVLPQYQRYKIRFANFVMNPLDTLSIYSRRQVGEVVSDITHKNHSGWVELDLPAISDTLELRKKGTTTVLASLNGFSPAGLRMYTIVGRGKTGVTGKGYSIGALINR